MPAALAELLRAGLLKSVYHGSASTETLKQLVHNYDSLTSDTTRCISRIKSIFLQSRPSLIPVEMFTTFAIERSGSKS